MSDADSESPTASVVHDDIAIDAGPRALVFWQGGYNSVALPDRGQLSVGRSKACDLRIDHPSVSRKHVLLHIQGAALRVEDLGGSNGTRINAKPIVKRSVVAVAPGDVVELGSAVLIIQRGGGTIVDTAALPARVEDPVVVSKAMKQLYHLVDMVSPSRIGVLIIGETGVGKELMARAVHERSPRNSGPFVAVNCAAIPDALIESELFGHERGAFTGADRDKVGLFETADGGTLLLDEVGELAPSAQAKLLRVLESGELKRVGGVTARRVDVRMLAATNRSPQDMVDAGTFRSDLYYRLNGMTLAVPPLRDRREDIAPLARAFAGDRELTAGAIDALHAHSWPGNVRELRNTVERAVVLSGGAPVRHEHIQVGGGALPPTPSAPPDTMLKAEIEALERKRITDALVATGGNQTRAAELLGMSRRTLVNRIEAFGLPRPRKGRPK